MKLFERTGGHWVFWTSAIYLAIALPCALYFKEIRSELIQLVWLVVFSLPLWCNPLARWLNMKETHMFDMFKKKTGNVVPFPGNETGYKDGDSPPPQEPKKPAVTYYSLGMTSENRLEFKMGYSAITMNYGGVTNLIEQLETFKKQLAQYEGIEEANEQE